LNRAERWATKNETATRGAAKRQWAEVLGHLFHRFGGYHTARAAECAAKGRQAEAEQERRNAVAAHEKSVALYKRVFGPDDFETLTHKRCLGCMYLNIGETRKGRELTVPVARKRSQHLLRLLKGTRANLWKPSQRTFARLGTDAQLHVRMLAYEFGILGSAAMQRKRFAQAARYFRREMSLLDAVNDSDQGFPIASSSARLAAALDALHANADQRELRERARNILLKHPSGKYVRYNCRLDVPAIRDELDAHLPPELL
jgi:tetratricopeptide (TPR) repeat protein